MQYLLGYGSLIHPDETKRHLFRPTCQTPVKIFGFKRVFNQKVTSRKTNGNKAAVLNVEKQRNSWINAILLGGFSEEFHSELDKRESGYDRITIPHQDLCPYDSFCINNTDIFYIYTGKKDAQDNSLLPITEYLELCLEGANTYNKLFYEDFLETTFIPNGISIKKYIS